jgi:predicted Fe-Mo cluster-binding NifX family protein
MRFAISTEEGFVSPHFGRCSSFTIVDLENNKVIGQEVVENPGHHPGYLPEFLHKKNVDCIVCGGIGQRAAGLFSESGIDVISGIEGTVSSIISKLSEGKLNSTGNPCIAGKGKNYGLEKTECEHKKQ